MNLRKLDPGQIQKKGGKMSRKILFCIVAALMILPAVLSGCGTTGIVGDPVSIKMLIRSEDQRTDIGDYVGNQLEELGFTVTRQYGRGSEIGPIWQGEPADGEWNIATCAWINTAVPRDEGSNFGAFYTTLWADMGPLWAAYTPTDEFMVAATKLWWNDFATMAERQTLFEEALPDSMEDSVRVFLDDRTSFTPLRKNVAAAADAYGGVEGSWLWANTIHFEDASGTPVLPAWAGGPATLTMKIALEDLLVNPWNPVAGSNWAFDAFPMKATGEMGMEYDPRDGLAWPHVASKAELTYVAGLPVGQSSGSASWLTVTTSPTDIAVPSTAWYDWDAVADEWITAGAGRTAKTKTVVYYPTGTFGRPLHDGSTMDAADFLMYTILQFDRAKTDSDIYDPDYKATYDAFMQHFKGFVWDFNQPGYDLVITTYDDLVLLDAELIARQNTWFPSGSYGPYVWHNLALGYLAEKDMESAFSKAKATDEGIEWISLIAGPSLVGDSNTKGLAQYLNDVTTQSNANYGFIPYKNVIGDYIDQAHAVARYNNLKTFYNTYGHLQVASGPYFLSDVDTTGDKLELDAFTSYPDAGDMWFFTMDPVPSDPSGHIGPWVDKITVEIETHDNAISRLHSGGLDVYAAGLANADLFETVKADSSLHYYLSAGLFDELTLNPSGPFFPSTGKLNPFALPAIREALNWAIDRDYIVGEIYGGMAYARYTCVGTVTGDYINRYPALFAATNAAYDYNFDKADAAIEDAMLTITGVSREADGKYYYTEPTT